MSAWGFAGCSTPSCRDNFCNRVFEEPPSLAALALYLECCIESGLLICEGGRMQVCAKCGDYNTEENIFCQHCGHRLNNRCPDCGFPNLPEQKFCGNCNKQLLTDNT